MADQPEIPRYFNPSSRQSRQPQTKLSIAAQRNDLAAQRAQQTAQYQQGSLQLRQQQFSESQLNAQLEHDFKRTAQMKQVYDMQKQSYDLELERRVMMDAMAGRVKLMQLNPSSTLFRQQAAAIAATHPLASRDDSYKALESSAYTAHITAMKELNAYSKDTGIPLRAMLNDKGEADFTRAALLKQMQQAAEAQKFTAMGQGETKLTLKGNGVDANITVSTPEAKLNDAVSKNLLDPVLADSLLRRKDPVLIDSVIANANSMKTAGGMDAKEWRTHFKALTDAATAFKPDITKPGSGDAEAYKSSLAALKAHTLTQPSSKPFGMEEFNKMQAATAAAATPAAAAAATPAAAAAAAAAATPAAATPAAATPAIPATTMPIPATAVPAAGFNPADALNDDNANNAAPSMGSE